ncbi:MAG: hypothetical protein FJX77_15270, partial [Armatimonadetes bacterium]|nr:hypothetical protein [Armatimonadota bacterium]
MRLGALRQAVSSTLTLLVALCVVGAGGAESETKSESFDRDPGWDGRNHRSPAPAAREVRQDFGFSRTSYAGGQAPGEIGGFVCPAAEPAYYAKPIPTRSFSDVLSASGTLVVAPGGNLDDGAGNTLLGFFNAGTIQEWRTPNTIALRINGRGSGFHAHVEYATARWRAGAVFFSQRNPDTGRLDARLIPSGRVVHRWSITYDPNGNGGGGSITATLDGETLVCNLDPGHKADGATFNRFGLLNVMKSADQGGSLWLDDLTVNGVTEGFDRDPGWRGWQNRRRFASRNVRPRFDFGYSATRHAGGKGRGEVGGLVFRGDQRYPDRMAYYGDRIETRGLEQSLTASGRVCLRRGVTDSTVLFGFFHATDSMRVGPEQTSGCPEDFLGVAIEGPSAEGFFVYPVYGTHRESVGRFPRFTPPPPTILPDGKPHTWSLEYRPEGAGGRILVALD